MLHTNALLLQKGWYVQHNLSGSSQEDLPGEEGLKAEALTPEAVLSMLPASLALSVVWRANYKTKNNVR